MMCGIKDLKAARVGDTLYAARPGVPQPPSLPGFKPAKAMVRAGLLGVGMDPLAVRSMRLQLRRLRVLGPWCWQSCRAGHTDTMRVGGIRHRGSCPTLARGRSTAAGVCGPVPTGWRRTGVRRTGSGHGQTAAERRQVGAKIRLWPIAIQGLRSSS